MNFSEIIVMLIAECSWLFRHGLNNRNPLVIQMLQETFDIRGDINGSLSINECVRTNASCKSNRISLTTAMKIWIYIYIYIYNIYNKYILNRYIPVYSYFSVVLWCAVYLASMEDRSLILPTLSAFHLDQLPTYCLWLCEYGLIQWMGWEVTNRTSDIFFSVYPHVSHDDVIKWKHFPRYWPFVRRNHRSPVNSPHKGQWRGAFIFSLICARLNLWVNNREAGDLRRHRDHYDVIEMIYHILQGSVTGTGVIVVFFLCHEVALYDMHKVDRYHKQSRNNSENAYIHIICGVHRTNTEMLRCVWWLQNVHTKTGWKRLNVKSVCTEPFRNGYDFICLLNVWQICSKDL